MTALAAILKLFLASSPEPKGQLTRNLVGSFQVTCKSKVAKIVPIANSDRIAAVLKDYFSLLLNEKAN